jgi:hypothetical protein
MLISTGERVRDTINHMTSLKRIVKPALMYAAGILFLLFTNPKSMPSLFLIVPFILFFIANYLLVVVLLGLFDGDIPSERKKSSKTHPRLVAALISGFPTLLFILQSIGQLTARDTITTLVIFLLAYFYVARISPTSSKR